MGKCSLAKLVAAKRVAATFRSEGSKASFMEYNRNIRLLYEADAINSCAQFTR
jgi:hypothetical protein